jgi:hypothetical protein
MRLRGPVLDSAYPLLGIRFVFCILFDRLPDMFVWCVRFTYTNMCIYAHTTHTGMYMRIHTCKYAHYIHTRALYTYTRVKICTKVLFMLYIHFSRRQCIHMFTNTYFVQYLRKRIFRHLAVKTHAVVRYAITHMHEHA